MTVPIWFSLTSSALPTPLVDPSLQDLRVGDEHIVADQLHAVAERLRQQLPAVPVALGEAVLDRDDRILPHPVVVELDHLRPSVRVGSPDFLNMYVPLPAQSSLDATSSAMNTSLPAL